MEFTEDMKKEPVRTDKFFRYGVHTVQMVGFSTGKSEKKGTDYIEIGFVDPENEECEGSVKIWFTDKSAIFSIDRIRQIILHNTPEDKHDKAKEAINSCKNHEELAVLLSKKMTGKEAFISVYPEPYTTTEGEAKKGSRTEIYGYPVKLDESKMPKNNEGVTVDDAKEVFNDDVPFKGGGTTESDWA